MGLYGCKGIWKRVVVLVKRKTGLENDGNWCFVVRYLRLKKVILKLKQADYSLKTFLRQVIMNKKIENTLGNLEYCMFEKIEIKCYRRKNYSFKNGL